MQSLCKGGWNTDDPGPIVGDTPSMMLRVDLHVHTRVSPDGITRPERVVARAKRMGLDAIAITDHDRCAAYAHLVAMGLADPSGRSVDGLLVIPGVEVSCQQGHLLVLGASYDSARKPTARDAVARAHDLGALAVAAHPMDLSRSGMGAAVMDGLPLDAVEGWNSKTLSRGANLRAIAYADQRGLPIVAGSDAHFAGTLGRAHTLVDASELTTASVLGAIAAGRTQIVPGQHRPSELARYWAQGWLTRPWLLDVTARGIAARLTPRPRAMRPATAPFANATA